MIDIPSTDHLIRMFVEQGQNLTADERDEMLAGIEQIESLRIQMLRIIAQAQSRTAKN